MSELKGTNKKDMTVREVLMHQAGLKPGIATWEKTITKTGPKPTFYASTESPQFSKEVTPDLYSLSTSEDSVWLWVQRSTLLPKVKGKYPVEYSDLSFIILKRVAEKVLKQPIEDFLQKTFYQ
ncbi:serine hydrolase, partial [Hymenobacter sp. AT01-02]|uniref:serine hydrolase n=1 Tax=Hymenobacter sp. AT01-02 TaxID=1571877 RepID=UPI0006E38B9C